VGVCEVPNPKSSFWSPSQKPIEGPRKAKGILKQMLKDIQFRESRQVAHKGTQKTISFKTRGVSRCGLAIYILKVS
jgi:hypothetical protein